MINKAILVGLVGNQPEIRTMQSGNELATFNLATTERWKDKSTGERKENTEWHRITVMSKGLVNVVKQYVNKGDKLYIEGKLKTDKYQKDGVDHYSTKIFLSGYDASLVMLSQKSASDNQHSVDKGNAYVADDLDDEVPF